MKRCWQEIVCCCCWRRGNDQKKPPSSSPRRGTGDFNVEFVVPPSSSGGDSSDPESVFQRSLYRTSSGEIGLAVSPAASTKKLSVTVLGARNLPIRGTASLQATACVYVKVSLYPEGSPKYTTKNQPLTANPNFGDTFIFPIRPGAEVKVTVWSYDKTTRKCLIGQNTAPLTMGEVWVTLKGPERRWSGQVMVSLCHSGTTLRVGVLRLRSPTKPPGGRDAFYIKLTLNVANSQKHKSKKSPVFCPIKWSDVEIGHVFTISAPKRALSELRLVLGIWAVGGPLSGRLLIGSLDLGPSECPQWDEMLNHPGATALQWYSI